METRRFVMGAALALAISTLPGGVAAAGGSRDRVSPACGAATAGPVAVRGAAGSRSSGAVAPAVGTWTSSPITTLPQSGTEGGLAIADDQHATIVATQDTGAWAYTTANGGTTWSAPVRLTSVGWHVLTGTLTQRGADVDIANAAYKGDLGRILVRHSPDGGATWGPTTRLPGSVYEPVLARGADGLVVLSSSPDPVVRVRISRDGGATFGAPVRVGAYDPGAGCVYEPGLTGLAVSGKVVLLFHWKNSTKMIVHRSPDGGRTWQPARTIRAGTQGHDTVATAVDGSTVLVAFHSGQNLVIRRSTDRGLTWSAPVAFTSGGWGVALAHADGAWHITYTHGKAQRYRSSMDGLTWSAEETVASYTTPDSSRPLGVGIVGGTVVVPWIHASAVVDQEGLEWGSRD